LRWAAARSRAKGCGRPAALFVVAAAVVLGLPALGDGGLNFSAPHNWATGAAPSAVAFVDTSHDGRPDYLLSADSTAGDVASADVHGAGSTAALITGVGTPADIAVADFDGDGVPDFATLDRTNNTVTITEPVTASTYASGGAAAHFTVAVGVKAAALAAGDVNNDGHPDIVVANMSGSFDEATITVILNSGVRSASAFAATQLFLNANASWGEHLALGDVNGDGKLDVILGTSFAQGFVVLLGNGAGGFSVGNSYVIGYGAAVVAVGDLNGDGKLDVVASGANYPELNTLLGNGLGGFTLKVARLNVGSTVTGIGTADFDGDGKRDVVLSDGSGVVVLPGQGNGNLGSPASFAAGAGPNGIAVGDVDGNGKPDVGTANKGSNTVSLFSNTSDAVPPVIAAPPGVAVSTGPGNTTGTVLVSSATLGTATATDDSGTVVVGVSGVPAGNLFPIGTTTLTWTATDPAGNTATATQNVVVTDNTPPIVTAPVDKSVNTGAGNTTGTVSVSLASLGTATKSDNSGGLVNVVRTGVPSGNLYPIGVTTITYTASDSSGNTAVATQKVTVVDNTKPVVTVASSSYSTGPGNVNGKVVVPDSALGTAIDNSGVPPTLTRTGVPAGNAFPIGVTSVRLTATDSSGNSITSPIFTITVVDNTVPTISAPADVTLSTGPGNTNGTITLTSAQLGAPTASDNSGAAPTITRSPSSFTFGIGTTTVTWTAKDATNNTATAVQHVTILDSTPPTLTVPATVSVSTGPGNTTGTVVVPSTTIGTATATDNSGSAPVISVTGVPAGNVFPIGTTVLTWKATDASSNVTTGTQNVVVRDTTPPLVTAPAIVNVATGPGNTSGKVVVGDAALGAAVYSDNSGAASLARTGVPSGNAFPIGTTDVIYAVTDAAGNAASATQHVVVTDSTPPVLAVPSDVTVDADAASPTTLITDAALGTATATDNSGSVTVTRSGIPAGNRFPVGTTLVTYTATDPAGLSSTATQAVTVVDHTPPVLLAPQDVLVDTGSGSTDPFVVVTDATLGSPLASDNNGAPVVTRNGVPAGNRFPIGTTTIAYTATDASGNAVTALQDVLVVDDTHPALNVPDDVTVQTAPGDTTGTVIFGEDALGSATGSDNSGLPVGIVRAGVPSGGAFPIGVTDVVYTATDAYGNLTTLTQHVTVLDRTPPVIVVPSPVLVVAAPQFATAFVDETLLQAFVTDNSGAATVTRDPSGNSFPLGPTHVTYTATDAAGNIGTASLLVTVLDLSPPTVTVPSDITVHTASDDTTGQVVLDDAALGVVSATDESGPVSVSRAGVPAGNAFPIGVTTITYSSTDSSGNTGTATQTVTVVDATPPTVSAPASVSVATAPDDTAGAAVVSDGALGSASAFDNSGHVTVARSGVPAGHTFPIGATTVTYTATDNAGNTSTSNQTVTVADATAPRISAPGSIVVATGPTDTSGTVVVADSALGAPLAIDNSGSFALSRSGVPGGNAFPIGVTTITHTATDAAGNVSSATQTVTVLDATPPTLVAPADVTVSTLATDTLGSALILDAALGSPTATDNSTHVATTRVGVPVGNLFPIGTTDMTYAATDPAGNVTHAVQHVTVLDATAPVVTSSVVGPRFLLGVSDFLAASSIVRVHVSDPNSPVASCSITVSGPLGATLRTCIAGDNDVLLSGPDGTYGVSVDAADAGGNHTIQSRSAILDATVPAFGACPTGPFASGSGTITVTISATDAGSGIDPAASTLSRTIPATPGSTTVDFAAVDHVANSAATSCTIGVTLYAATQKVRDQVSVLIAGAAKPELEALRDALKKLDDSLDASVWLADGNHLTAKKGEQVFEAQKNALQKLEKLAEDKHSGVPAATVLSLAANLLEIDRQLAQLAIQQAADAGADAKKLAEAQKNYAQAVQDAARGRDEQAVEGYAAAWKKAQDALKKS
jgi:hypothetical protein